MPYGNLKQLLDHPGSQKQQKSMAANIRMSTDMSHELGTIGTHNIMDQADGLHSPNPSNSMDIGPNMRLSNDTVEEGVLETDGTAEQDAMYQLKLEHTKHLRERLMQEYQLQLRRDSDVAMRFESAHLPVETP